jgi:hypothetical protein
LFVDFTKLTPASKAEKVISQFNMTTKVVYLKPKSTICGLNEVKVMRHTDLGKADKYARNLESKESNTGNIYKKT